MHVCINGLFGQVGDFGLARRQSSGEVAEETRVLGTIGYLAPEYAETGKITDKADVYAFGVVLLELITGRKSIDYTRARNEVSLTDWVRISMLLYHLVTTVTALSQPSRCRLHSHKSSRIHPVFVLRMWIRCILAPISRRLVERCGKEVIIQSTLHYFRSTSGLWVESRG